MTDDGIQSISKTEPLRRHLQLKTQKVEKFREAHQLHYSQLSLSSLQGR